MTAAPPPWRVFDSPTPEAAEPNDYQEHGSEAPTSGVRPPGSTAGRTAVRPDVLVGLAAALGGLVLAWLLATGQGGSIALGGGTELLSSEGPGAPAAPGPEVVVDVVGAVLRPGVYHLPGGSRVGDAITAAGGFGPRVAAGQVDRDLNLAAVLHDGDQVVVPSRDEVTGGPSGGATSTGSGGTTGLIDLNTASESDLESLPGIGPVTAGKIITSRSAEPFRSVDQLLERKLVGQKTFDAIKGLVTVGS